MDSFEFLAYSQYDNETINLLLEEQSKKYILSGMEIILKSVVLLIFWYWKNMISINTFVILLFSLYIKNNLDTMVNEIEQIKINLGFCFPNDNKQMDIVEENNKKNDDYEENIDDSENEDVNNIVNHKSKSDSLSDISNPSTQKKSNCKNVSTKLNKNYRTTCKKNHRKCVYKTALLEMLSDTDTESDSDVNFNADTDEDYILSDNYSSE